MSKSKKKINVLVTGTGCVSSLGATVDTCIANMFEGKRNPKIPTRFSTGHLIEHPVFPIHEDFLLSSVSVNKDLALTAQFGLTAVSQALADAAFTADDLKNLRVGVCMGTTVGSALNNDQFYIDYKHGKTPGMAPVKRFLNSNPAACIADCFNLTGPVQTIVNACASGTDAIGIGALWIKSGLCDLVIAGGADELCKVTYNGFISLRITDNEPCRPFDKMRKGLNLGEGAGAVILQSDTSASFLTATPKCRIAGYASACDAHHLTAPSPEGRGLERAITQALSESGLETYQIGFVNAHGTGTKDNDLVEDKILSKLLPEIPFFSTKGYTGHTLGAAGALEAVFTIQHLLDGRIPESIGFTQQDNALKQTPVQQAVDMSCHAAISQSVAFGGNNSVLVFSKI